jgi:hypothetical protein
MSTIDDLFDRARPAPARTHTAGPTPTGQQQAILDAFATGDHAKIEAGAGTGKTTTLTMVAAATTAPGRYLAFNKAIAGDAQAKMPTNVVASTAHSLAYRSIISGHPKLTTRLQAPRLRPSEVATIIGIDTIVLRTHWGRKYLQPWRLAGIVQRALAAFCRSADDQPGPQHFGWLDGIDPPGDTRHNDDLAAQLTPALRRAWADLTVDDGVLPLDHDHYLKRYALTHPRLACDFVMLDEAQDSNPVLAQIVEEQLGHAQVIVVGDTAQQIYEWNGAVNTLANFDIERRLWLTQSWRFGPAVADVANRILDAAGLELRITGNPARPSTVEHLHDDQVDAVLCRTNAQVLVEVLTALEHGRKVALVEGHAKELLAFVNGAEKLQRHEKSTHRDLACFDTWAEVQEYVEADSDGSNLKVLVKIVDRFGCKQLIRILAYELVPERQADVVVSTAHKAKGREWPRVRLAGDLTVERDEITDELPVDEMRLLYVAATRARDVLDAGAVPLQWPTVADTVSWAGGLL